MEKVLVGMSGGVDSAATALLLKKQGYDVYGATMKLWCEKNYTGDLDSKRLCDSIGISHYTFDFQNEFKDKVIDNFVTEYKNYRTPNPCIECNKHLKFKAMYLKAKELGFDKIATGHYAKIEYSDKYKRFVIKKADNLKKDQSYVLYGIQKEMLNSIVMPLGYFKSKDEVRSIVNDYDVEIANKKDSEDICFIPSGNYKEFLEKNTYIKPTSGNIVNIYGKVLGKHNGLYNYTIGQRKGLGISNKEPLFVIGFNSDKNELIVGEKDKLFKREMYVKNFNLLLIDELKEKMNVKIKTRYSSKEAIGTIEMFDLETIKVVFEEPASMITPGQSAVFYVDDIVLGGGIIEKV